jgi:hypothetical protein
VRLPDLDVLKNDRIAHWPALVDQPCATGDNAMTQRLLLVVLLLGGCTEMMEQPTREELDWNPPTLSKTGCPDLSGRYLAPHNDNYRWIFPNGSERELHPSREVYLRDKDLNIFITVESRPTGIQIRADNGRNAGESFTVYDGVNVGCHNGVLASRYTGPFIRPAESGNCTSLSYGERRVHRNEQGDLVVVRTQRERCSTWGSLTRRPPPKESTMGPFIFRRVK